LILTPILFGNQFLEPMFLGSYVCMIIDIFVGKIIGTKTGIVIEKDNNSVLEK